MGRSTLKDKILYFGILVVLMLPLLQRYFYFAQERELKGVYVHATSPEFKITSWLDGSYQDSSLQWLNETSGFHRTLVRVRNQIGWELFGYAYANKTIRGEEGYLYDIDNIKAYNGSDFIGIDSLRYRAENIKYLQTLFEGQGITMVVVLAPGKASYYPEHIPQLYRAHKGPTNYEVFSDQLKKNDVNLIDFHSWFDTLKTTSKVPLFPKCGLHWGKYGALLAGDSLIGYIGGKIRQPLPRFVIDSVYMSDSLRDPDFDIGSVMNLYWDVQPPPMPYANFHAGPTNSSIRPRVIIVGDSYVWTMPINEFRVSAFAGVDFFYYYRDLFLIGEKSEPIEAGKVNLLPEIGGSDVVVLLCTETNLPRFPWGFTEKALVSLQDSALMSATFRKMHIAYLERGIRKDANWSAVIRAKAESEHVNPDTALRQNAIWVYEWQQKQKAEGTVK